MKRQIIAILLLPFLLAGCGRDAAELAVVTGIGIDGTRGDYHVGAEIIKLVEKQDENLSVVLNTDGVTITDGIDNMVALTGHTLYCNHTQVIVVSRETAEAGMETLLEELLQGTQYPIALRLAVAKGTASQVLRAKPVVSDLQSVELEKMIQESAKHCIAPDLNVCDFYEEICSPGIESILPFFEIRENEGEAVCRIAGTALFRDDQMLTVLGPEDSQCLMWMRGEQGGTLRAGDSVFEVIKMHRSLTAGPDGGSLTMKVTLGAGEAEEQKEQLIQNVEKAMDMQFRSLLKRLQLLQCDAVGFGSRMYQKHPRRWEQIQDCWPQFFSTYPLELKVEVEDIILGRIWSNAEAREQEANRYGS